MAIESVPQPFGLTGREYDRVSGIYHYRNRDYDPNTGRFLQEDPLWIVSGDLNFYRYVRSNPLSYIDPWGETALIEYACLAEFAVANGLTAGGAAGPLAAVFVDAATGIGHRHHIVPQQMLKQLSPSVAQEFMKSKYIPKVPPQIHRAVHKGKGCGRGGAYNFIFNKLLPDPKKATVSDVQKVIKEVKKFFASGGGRVPF